MKADNFSLQDYFARIRYEGDARADIATVTALMRHQLFSVPFENLDVQAGKVVSLVPEEIVRKIIGSRRGGYCYEVNGLFAMALDALGIPYRFVAARPMVYPTRRPKTHMALVASCDGGEWLCDLGFGSYGIRSPMRLDRLDVEVRHDQDSFMLTREDGGDYIVKASVKGAWACQYSFDLSPQEWLDFTLANHFNSTHPDTIFVKKLLVILHQPAGRTILLGDVLKTIVNGNVEKRIIAAGDRENVLRDVFGLVPGNSSQDTQKDVRTLSVGKYPQAHTAEKG